MNGEYLELVEEIVNELHQQMFDGKLHLTPELEVKVYAAKELKKELDALTNYYRWLTKNKLNLEN